MKSTKSKVSDCPDLIPATDGGMSRSARNPMKKASPGNRLLKPAMASLFLLVACTVGDPMRIPSGLPVGSNDSVSHDGGWRAVLSGPSPIQEFEVFHTGEVEVPVEGMLNLEAMDSPPKEETMFVSVFSFWFCHRQHGCYLIDSGLDDSFGEGKEGNVRGLLASQYIISSRQKPGQDILSHLDSHRKQRLKGVFFTHLHGDHTSGVPALSADPALKDLEYYVAKGEEYINLWMLYQGDHLDRVSELRELDLARGVEMPILGRCMDVFGDGSLWAIPTPGHSSAHLSYLIRTPGGPVLLTGDASHTRLGFEKGVEPGWTDDRSTAQKSLARLREFSARFPEVRLIYGHER